MPKESIRRNERIADLFFRMDKVELAGTGIRRMREAMVAASLSPPKIRQTTFFTITFKRPMSEDKTSISTKTGRQSTSRTNKVEVAREVENFAQSSEIGSEIGSEKICSTIKNHPKISARELSIILGISSRAVEKRLAQLKKTGAIKRIGSAKGGHWEVVDG